MQGRTIGERIRAARTAAGFETGRKFAGRLGIDAAQLSRYEHDHVTPSAPMLRHIASVCGVWMEWLLTGEGVAQRPAQPPAATGTDGD